MGISCGATLIKYILFVFNVLWLILGGVVLWLGFSITSFSGDLKEVLDTNMKAGAITILIAGFIIFFIAFLGCCGACKENSCMLSTYGGIILILVVLQCVGAYFAIKYNKDIKGELQKGVKDKFRDFHQSNDIAKVVQSLQKTFECCGYDQWRTDYQGQPPSSCCGDTDWKDNPKKTCAPANVKYDKNCVDAISDKVSKYLGGLAGVAIAIVAIQIIVILSACCLSREVRN